MSTQSDFRALVCALCVRIVALALVCVFAENVAIWLYLLSPYSVIIRPDQFVLWGIVLCVTIVIALAGVVILAFLDPDER